MAEEIPMAEDIQKLKKDAEEKYKKVAAALQELKAAKTKKTELVAATEKMKTDLEQLPD
jgi:hypothetical protein